MLLKYSVFLKIPAILLFFIFLTGNLNAQVKTYILDASHQKQNITRGHLRVQPHPDAKDQFDANNQYFEKNGKPWFPVMGEFHYSRYPHEYWEEEILKMKNAGLQIIATYVFWNAHEDPKGTWNWNDDRNLRKFIELCKKHDMYVWLRIGPWSHGEQLYGGHPEWISKMRGKRSNNTKYLKEVDTLFYQIGQQTKGLYHNSGGPVIGVQLENEYASGQEDHIDRLRELALKNGITPVYFSITGNTVFKSDSFGYFPLQGAYPYRGWEKNGGNATKDFLYANDQWILTDAVGKVYYDTNLYPKGLCEQGCGSQMTYRNRFVVRPGVVEAHLQNQIGRGMNLIGYYMFHGGTQIPGLKEPGYPESYDFQAPISEFGLLRPSYKYLKILHNFIHDFGKELAVMEVTEPENPVRDEKNTKDLRYVARVKGNSGFLFLNNTQVRIKMPDKSVRFRIILPDEILDFPKTPVILKGKTTAILPFNLKLNSAILRYSNSQPLAYLKNSDSHILFLMQLKGNPVELAFDSKTISKISAENWQQETENGVIILTKKDPFNDPVTITGKNGKRTLIRILTRKEAENSWRIKLKGKESLVITTADLMFDGDVIELRQTGKSDFSMEIFPKPVKNSFSSDVNLKITEGLYSMKYSAMLPKVQPGIPVSHISKSKSTLTVPKKLPENCSDFIMKIDYLGGSATARINGTIVTDDLFNGQTWNFGLKRFILKNPGDQITFEAKPWSKRITGIPQEFVKKVKKYGAKIENLIIDPQYRILLKVH